MLAASHCTASSCAHPTLANEAQHVQQQLCCEECSRAGMVVVRSDLAKIHPHDLAPAAQCLEELQNLVVEESSVTGCAGTGRDRWVEGVDVQRHVVARTFRDALGDCLHSH